MIYCCHPDTQDQDHVEISTEHRLLYLVKISYFRLSQRNTSCIWLIICKKLLRLENVCACVCLILHTHTHTRRHKQTDTRTHHTDTDTHTHIDTRRHIDAQPPPTHTHIYTYINRYFARSRLLIRGFSLLYEICIFLSVSSRKHCMSNFFPLMCQLDNSLCRFFSVPVLFLYVYLYANRI